MNTSKKPLYPQSRQVKQVNALQLPSTLLHRSLRSFPHSQKHSIVIDYVHKKLELLTNTSTDLNNRTMKSSKAKSGLLLKPAQSKRRDMKMQYGYLNQRPISPKKDRNIEAFVLKEENKRLKGVIEGYQMKIEALRNKMEAIMKKGLGHHCSPKKDYLHYLYRNRDNKGDTSIHSLSITFSEDLRKDKAEDKQIKVNPNGDLMKKQSYKELVGKK